MEETGLVKRLREIDEKFVPTKIVFETFDKPYKQFIQIMTEENPFCRCGKVNVVRYRITVEEIEEPESVILDRIKKLTSEVNNVDLKALKTAAEKYGVELSWKKINRTD